MPPPISIQFALTDETKLNQFTEIFDKLAVANDYVNIISTSEHGIYIQRMNSTTSYIFETRLQPSWFTEYHCKNLQGDDNINIVINTGIINKILKMRKPDQPLLAVWNNSSSDKLSFTFEAGNKTLFTTEFACPLFDVIIDTLEIPVNTVHCVDILISADILRQQVSNLKFFDNNIQITCDDDGLRLSSKGDNGSMKVSINPEDLEEFALIPTDKPLVFNYNAEHFLEICSLKTMGEQVYLHLSNSIPMKIEYRLDPSTETTEDSDEEEEEEEESDTVDNTLTKTYAKFFMAEIIID
jgi:proliferating cell nuclear antigen PCNA